MPIIPGVVASSKTGHLNPLAPTIGTATDVGTSRAYNNGAATVAFTAAGTGPAATSYTAVSTPGSFTATGSSSPLTVTGLQSSTSYTFVVYATNAAGNSANSSASNSITATTVPQAPTIGTATATGQTTATLTYTANATGGLTNTFSVNGGGSGSGASPISITGLAAGTSYSFSVTATNSNGTATSGTSNTITTSFAAGGFVVAGASIPGLNRLNTISKFTYSTETFATISAVWSSTNQNIQMAGVTNIGSAGYTWGGESSSGVSPDAPANIHKLSYLTEAVSVLSSTVSNGAYNPQSVSNSGTAGYAMAGVNNTSTFVAQTSIGKLTYSSETGSVISATTPTAVQQGAGIYNSGTAGYSMGGVTGTTVQNVIYKLTYSNDTVSTPSATLSATMDNSCGVQNGSTAGYIAGGNNGSNVFNNLIQKLLYSTDTRTTLSATLSNSTDFSMGISLSGTAGYISNGEKTTSPYYILATDKLTYSSETKSTVSSTLSNIAYQGAPVNNG